MGTRHSGEDNNTGTVVLWWKSCLKMDLLENFLCHMDTENSSSLSKSPQMDLLLKMPKPSHILKPHFCTNVNIYTNMFQT
jgi:hypothetical protein